MRRSLCLFGLFLFFSLTGMAANVVTVVVSNDENVQQQGLVEVDFKIVKDRLGIGDDDGFVVKNAFGQQVEYQLTYDGKLLFDAAVRPCGTADFKGYSFTDEDLGEREDVSDPQR